MDFIGNPTHTTSTTLRVHDNGNRQVVTPSNKVIRRISREDQFRAYGQTRVKLQKIAYRRLAPVTVPSEHRKSPLPALTFADGTEVWDLMCKMDLSYKRNPDTFKNHPDLAPQMRNILLSWIMEVCESYNLHRETMYLTIDYFDRYMAVERDIPKQSLQLIGMNYMLTDAVGHKYKKSINYN